MSANEQQQLSAETDSEIRHLRGFIIGVEAVRAGLANGYLDEETESFIDKDNADTVYTRLQDQFGEQHPDLFTKAAEIIAP